MSGLCRTCSLVRARFSRHCELRPAGRGLQEGNQLSWMQSLPPRLVLVSGVGSKGPVAREVS